MFKNILLKTDNSITLPPDVKISLWAKDVQGNLFPSTGLVPSLESGIYTSKSSLSGISLSKLTLESKVENLVQLSNDIVPSILADLTKFKQNKNVFIANNIDMKKSILISGPQNSGKTIAMYKLVTSHVNSGGVVFVPNDPLLAITAVSYIKRIDPTTDLLVCIDDIDGYIETYGEENVRQLVKDINISTIIASNKTPLDFFNVIKTIGDLSTSDKEKYLNSRFPTADILQFKKILNELIKLPLTIPELENIGILLVAHEMSVDSIVKLYTSIKESKVSTEDPAPTKNKSVVKQLFLDKDGNLKTIVEQTVDDVIVLKETENRD